MERLELRQEGLVGAGRGRPAAGGFARGIGTVAIADPDEWDDIGNPAGIGTFNSFLKTPPINITGIRSNSLALTFDSSFRPEGNQKATVTASFDGGAAVTSIEWIATDDNKTNERFTLNLEQSRGRHVDGDHLGHDQCAQQLVLGHR